jgi:hypothetical protein
VTYEKEETKEMCLLMLMNYGWTEKDHRQSKKFICSQISKMIMEN